MRLKTIRVSAGCTIPHPHQQFSNIKLFVEATVDIGPKESPEVAAKEAQEAVNYLLTAERVKRLGEIEFEYEAERKRREEEHAKQRALRDAEQQVQEAERRLQNLRAGHPADYDEMPF